jgi:hypothetical protein
LASLTTVVTLTNLVFMPAGAREPYPSAGLLQQTGTLSVGAAADSCLLSTDPTTNYGDTDSL